MDGRRQPTRGRAVEALTNSRVVSEEDVHEAMEVLRSTIDTVGAARGRAIQAEAMLRHIKALEMTYSDERSTSAQERDAYASDRYRSAIEELREAVTAFEVLKAQRETAEMILEVWRTNQATERAATRI